MPRRLPVAAGLALAAAGALAQADGGWAVALRSDRHSDGVPLADLGADDAFVRLRPRAGRNLAWIDDELRASRRDGAWTWSLLARQSAALATDHDTLALVQQASGQLPATADRRWQTRLRHRQFSGGGIEAGRRFVPADGVQANLAAQALVLAHWRARSLDGPAAFDAATGTYRFELASQETDDRMGQPFQQPFARRGVGLLLHGDIAWQAGTWRLGLAVRDLGWLHWRGLPRQDLVLSTETRDVDADGFVIYRPLVQGRNRQDGLTQGLGGWWTLRAAWMPDEQRRIEASIRTRAGFGALPALAWHERFGGVDLELGWRFRESRLSFGLAWQGLSLRIGADRLGGAAHSREFALVYARGW